MKLSYRNKQTTQALFKQKPEDFQVTEVLEVNDEGEGEHQWLWIKKSGANTRFVAEKLAKFAAVDPRQVSYSGLKDRNAVTWQWFSVQLPGKPMLDWSQFKLQGVEVKQVMRRTKKLKLGYHKANQFVIRLREVKDPRQFEANWLNLCEQGTINYFGSQRFGHQEQNISAARRWIAAEKPNKISKAKRSLWLSSMRSYLFNQVAMARFNCYDTKPLTGDCVMLGGSQSVFTVEHWDDDLLARLASGDIRLTCPMPGEDGVGKVAAAAREFELQQLDEYTDWIHDFAKVRLKASRRPYLLHLQQPALSWQGTDAVIEFTLPTGSFATTCINELINLTVTDNDENSVE
ncbi:MAG: tRNA pseudouridine(13) synthase TruD [Pseudomonadota bacterium]